MTGKLLACYPLLRLLSPAQLDDWLGQGQEIECASGMMLVQENTPGAWAYLVREGRVRILRQAGTREITLGMLQPGDFFGEYALLPPGRNTATCRTACPTRLLRLPLAPLRNALQGLKPVWKNLKNWLRLHTLMHFARERAFLGFMSADSALKLLDRLKPVTFPAGETIQAHGVAANHWYLIEHGTVRLGTEDLGPGHGFGEHGLSGLGDVGVAAAVSEVRCQLLMRHDFDPAAPIASQVAQSYQPRGPARPEAHVWVPQLEPTDCGLASLAMAGQRLGSRVTVEQLREKAVPGPQGLSLNQLRELAGAIGLSGQAVRVSADRLRQVNLPAIAHLSDGHYVVLHEVSDAGVVVGDPANGIVTWNIEFLARCYTGSLLLVERPAG